MGKPLCAFSEEEEHSFLYWTLQRVCDLQKDKSLCITAPRVLGQMDSQACLG